MLCRNFSNTCACLWVTVGIFTIHALVHQMLLYKICFDASSVLIWHLSMLLCFLVLLELLLNSQL